MGAFDREQCIYSLDKAIAHLDAFEQNFEGADISVFSRHAGGIAARCYAAKVFLERWNEPDIEEDIPRRDCYSNENL